MARASLRFAVVTAILTAAFTLGLRQTAHAQQFNTGDHVLIGSTAETGTVMQVGQTTVEGGVMVKVTLDKPAGPTVADREVWYNSRSSRVTLVPREASPATPAAPAPALPSAPTEAKGAFKVGDRVRIGSLDVTGTVVEIGGVLGNGSVMMRVEIDKNAAKFPGRASWYDTSSSKITPAGN